MDLGLFTSTMICLYSGRTMFFSVSSTSREKFISYMVMSDSVGCYREAEIKTVTSLLLTNNVSIMLPAVVCKNESALVPLAEDARFPSRL